MMRLVTMVRGLSGDAVAREIAKRWEHDEGTVKFWRASTNFVYAFDRQGVRYFLRFSSDEDHSMEQLTAELDYMRFLAERGYPCALPVPSSGGNIVETVRTSEGIYYGVVFSAATGAVLNDEGVTKRQCRDWGRALARLHRLSCEYEPGLHRRRGPEQILQWIDGVLKRHPEEREAQEELYRICLWLQFMPASRQSFGLIHYDFQLDNVFYQADQRSFQVIDFDDSMYHWYAMDIASTLADTECRIQREAFLEGYRSIRSLEPETEAELPRFRRFGRLYSFARLLRSLEQSDLVLDDAPPWYKGLRDKLMAYCDDDRRSFSEPW
ncbi:phosphotransferase enzyme family protein [Paenibacillus lactis]|uniref:phosphotransferase enzyme family protein n=1 Tax=Paenibacillus lactis TaxID=228574 RepID=UPI0036C2CF7B